MKATYYDCFNLICGEKLGHGIHRAVFECAVRKDLVVKVESDDRRYFANVMEMKFWCDNKDNKQIARWLAPCEFLSPDGRILLQKKVSPIPDESMLPRMVPEFLEDLKMSNFGIFEGRVVCVDYAIHTVKPAARMQKAVWS